MKIKNSNLNDAVSVFLRRTRRVLFFLMFGTIAIAQTPCPVTATVNPNGTINLNAPNITVVSQCHDHLNVCFIATLYLVECTNIAEQYVLMVSDVGKVYHFNLPYQSSSYFGQWCGQTNFATWYQAIKHDPEWRHDSYKIPCTKTLSTGVSCSRQSELSLCWQHR